MDPRWQYALVLGAALLHVLLVVAAYRVHADSLDADPAATADADGVACPECGAVNEPDYRFCRGCVGELPGGRARVGEGTGGAGRRTP